MAANHTQKRFSRREFIKQSTVGIAAVSALPGLTGCSKTSTADAMPRRTLGKTGLAVSVLAFGSGSQFLKNENGVWEAMVERAIGLGINYFDTSANYGSGTPMGSEERLGTLLPKYRKDIVICTKFDPRTPDEAMKEVERSLKLLKTNYIDILMIHAVRAHEKVSDLEKGVYRTLQDLKSQGTVNYTGFSCMNSAELARDLVDTLDFDVCMIPISPTQYGKYAETVLPSAIKKNVGVLAMKVMRDIIGKDATARELISYSMSHQGVASLCIAHFGMETLEENAALIKEISRIKKADTDHSELETRLAQLAGPHRLCWARPDYVDGNMC